MPAPDLEPMFAGNLLRQLREAADGVAREVRTNERSWGNATSEQPAADEPAVDARTQTPATELALRELAARLATIEQRLAQPPACPIAGTDVEPMLQRIHADVEASRTKIESALGCLQQLGTDVSEIRVQLSAFGKVVVRTGVRLGELAETVRVAPTPAAPPVHDEPAPLPYWHSPLFAAGLVLVLVSWGVLLHFKTGDAELALAAVGLANLAGCSAMLASRRALSGTRRRAGEPSRA